MYEAVHFQTHTFDFQFQRANVKVMQNVQITRLVWITIALIHAIRINLVAVMQFAKPFLIGQSVNVHQTILGTHPLNATPLNV